MIDSLVVVVLERWRLQWRRRSRRREREVEWMYHRTPLKIGVAAVDLFPVEVPVAVTGGASERFRSSFIAAHHELSATVEDIAADARGVVLQALTISNAACSH